MVAKSFPLPLVNKTRETLALPGEPGIDLNISEGEEGDEGLDFGRFLYTGGFSTPCGRPL